MKPFFYACLYTSICLCPLLCLAEKNVVTLNYDAGTSIKVDHMFDEHVKSGFHPYKVTIRNGRSLPITWTLRFETNSSTYRYRSNYQIKVEPGSESIEELLVPAPPTKGHRYSTYRSVRVNVSAPGLNSISRSLNGSIDPNWPSVVMSKNLASRNLTRLANKRKEERRGQDYFASTFRELPASWKGMTCVDILMLDDTTWRGLPKQQKRSVLTWVRFGGRLDVFSDDKQTTLESLGFETPDSPGRKKGIYSLGTIEILHWNGKDLTDNLLNRYSGTRQFDDSFNKDYGKTWGMINEFGTRNFNPFLVFILLIIFAVLVGPVNLFHFAKAGQRHRLFITTPIISLIASLVIILIILVQDGMGGSGRRVAFVDIQSHTDQRQLQVLQQQISRTGVMIKSGFENKEVPGVTPVTLPPSRWNPVNNGQSRNTNYQFYGPDFGGDLFRSRSEQGYHIRTVRPTRSRIERRNPSTSNNPPQLFSSLEFAIKDFHYVDSMGVVWKAEPGTTIEPGAEIQLQKSSLNELQDWLKDVTYTLSSADRKAIRDLKSGRGRYFGIAANPEPLLVQTHSAIRWQNDVAIVSGITIEP